MRFVANKKNREGLIELGPPYGAYGLGDTLSITPVAKALGNRAVMLMPPAMAHLQFLFHDLCPVRVTDNFPVFNWTAKQAAQQKLEIFGLKTSSPLPVVNVRPELIAKAKAFLAGFPNPIVFCPTCSKYWEHMRQRPASFWTRVVDQLSERFTVCQFGRKEFPTVGKAKRMPFVDLETLAAVYREIGLYVGVDTGDYHLMLAVGGRSVVAEPDPLPPYQASIWWYDTPLVKYAKLSHPGTVMEAIKEMPF